MFEKLTDIEKRLMNVETCLIIQQNSSQTKSASSLSGSGGQLQSTTGRLSLSKSSPMSGTLNSNSSNNNNNNSTNNNNSATNSINNKLKQSLQYRNNNLINNSRFNLASPSSSSFLRSANLSPRFSLQQQRLLMQQQQLLNRQSGFGGSGGSGFSPKYQPFSYSHLSKRAKYELHHHSSSKSSSKEHQDSSKLELEEGEKPTDSSQQDSGGEEMGEELGEIAKKDTSMITNEDMGKEDDNENDADDDDNDSNVSSNLNLNIINKSMGSTSPSSYLKSNTGVGGGSGSGPNASSGELLMLATDETTGHILINDTDIRRIYAVSKSRGNFAALLVQQMYARQERIMSNVMGTRGKRQLSPRRMIVVKRLAFKMYPPPNEREEEIIWKKECVKAIDSKNRKVRIQPGGHRNVVDTSSPGTTSASNSANTSLNRASAAAAAFAAAQQHMRNPFQQLTPQQLSSLASVGHNQLARQNSAQAVAAMAAAAVAAAAAAHMSSQNQVVQQQQQQQQLQQQQQQQSILPVSSTSTSIKQEANTSPQMVTSSTSNQNLSSKQINTSTPNKDKDSSSQNLIQIANLSKDNLDNSSSKTTVDNDNLTDTSFNEADN